MVLSLLASGGPNDAPPFFILLTVVFMGIIAIALILAHFRQSLLAGYFICGVILADRKSTRLNSSHNRESRMPSSA